MFSLFIVILDYIFNISSFKEFNKRYHSLILGGNEYKSTYFPKQKIVRKT